MAGRVSATVAFKARFGAKSSKLTRLRVTEAPAGATVTVTCGAQKRAVRARDAHHLRQGQRVAHEAVQEAAARRAKVSIGAVTTPNAIGKVRRLTIARKRVTGRDAVPRARRRRAGPLLT